MAGTPNKRQSTNQKFRARGPVFFVVFQRGNRLDKTPVFSRTIRARGRVVPSRPLRLPCVCLRYFFPLSLFLLFFVSTSLLSIHLFVHVTADLSICLSVHQSSLTLTHSSSSFTCLTACFTFFSLSTYLSILSIFPSSI